MMVLLLCSKGILHDHRMSVYQTRLEQYTKGLVTCHVMEMSARRVSLSRLRSTESNQSWTVGSVAPLFDPDFIDILEQEDEGWAFSDIAKKLVGLHHKQ